MNVFYKSLLTTFFMRNDFKIEYVFFKDSMLHSSNQYIHKSDTYIQK